MKNPAHKDFYRHYRKLSNRDMHIWLNLDELLVQKKGDWEELALRFIKKYPEL